MDFLKIFFTKKKEKIEWSKKKAATEEVVRCTCCGHETYTGSPFCPYCGVVLRTPSGHEIQITGTSAKEVSTVLNQYQKTQEDVLRQKASAIEKASLDSDPFIFISYAHKNSEIVVPLLLKFKEHGFRIWFDENIEPASTWDDNIAEHIEKAEFFISMISTAYLESRNCLDELRYALSQDDKKQFLLYLHDVSLPKGIAMRTGGVQNIFRKTFDNDDAMIQHLGQVAGIDVCIQDKADSFYLDMDDMASNLLKMAKAGDADAQFEIGRCFYDGMHVRQSYSSAVSWYKKAAEQGMAIAQHNLALCYESGIGVETNPAEAFRWYTEAALQDYATAQNHLGLCYDTGIGTDINHENAVHWYMQAAEKGHSGAQLNLGLSYRNGEGVAKDLKLAKKWLQLSVNQGESRAQRALLSITLLEGETEVVNQNEKVEISDVGSMNDDASECISIEVPKGKFA